MTRQTCLGLVALVVLSVSAASLAHAAPSLLQTAASADATAAAKASPELIGALSKEMGATPEQAAGAAGALFGVAKSRLKADEFSQIATAVPGMDSLLKASPTAGSAGALSQLGAGASGLAGAASAFTKLGLTPDMVSKAVPVLTSFVTKSGGSKVGSLLAGALK
jgi:hypothetical protein